MTGTPAGVLALVLAAGLQACCFDAGDAAAFDAGDSGAPAAPVRVLRIVDWGPRETTAGVSFNVQPDGRSALWIRLDRSLDGRTALLAFDDAYLEAQGVGSLVTAAVPEASYARPGVYEVRVIASRGDASRWGSDAVAFTVRQAAAGSPQDRDRDRRDRRAP